MTFDDLWLRHHLVADSVQYLDLDSDFKLNPKPRPKPKPKPKPKPQANPKPKPKPKSWCKAHKAKEASDRELEMAIQALLKQVHVTLTTTLITTLITILTTALNCVCVSHNAQIGASFY